MPLGAEISWDTQKVELTPAVGEIQADGRFGFVNAGKEAITIESVKSSCGCTVPKLEKKIYGPGERGELLTHFLIGDRRGVQSKTIRVQVEGERKPAELTLVVKIPELLSISPPMLIWEQGEASNPKTFFAKAQATQAVLVRRVTSTNPRMKIQVDALTEGRDYGISVTPTSTDQPGMALVMIEASVDGQPKSFTAYLQIKPKPR